MVSEKESGRQKAIVVRDKQRYFKVTTKGRAPKVTRVWEADEMPWYIRYAYDWTLLLIALPILVARASVSSDGWVSVALEFILIGIFFMWLVTLPPEEHER